MHRSTRFTVALAAALFCLMVSVSEAQRGWQPGDFGSSRFRLGIFQPAGDSQFWDTKAVDWTGGADDLDDWVFAFEYVWPTSRKTGFVFGFSFYEGSTTQAYRDWVDADGRDISHTTTLQTYEVSAAWMMRLRDRGQGISPYFGVGAGYVWWDYDEVGYFIDFASADQEIVFAGYYAGSSTWEALAFAGLELPVGHVWSLIGEARWKWMEDEMNLDFAGFGTIDLSGLEYSLGVVYNF